MFIESSSPRHLNDSARLVSATVPANQQYCLQFYYHMYGANINSLNVYLKVLMIIGLTTENGNLVKMILGNASLVWNKLMYKCNKYARNIKNNIHTPLLPKLV